jgi:glycosyltransferase involved in cell wall biosynthesis
VLFLCFYDPLGVSTISENIAYMQKFSRFPLIVLNLFEHRHPHPNGALALKPLVDLDEFSAILIHNTVSYNVDNLYSLDTFTPRKLRDYRGVKVLMKQDENFRFQELAEYIGKTKFDLILTCLADEDIAKIYPPDIVGTPHFVRWLTGYITPTLRALDPRRSERPIDIGYRGSIQPLDFGRLAFEKRKIGDDVARLLAGRGLRTDISSRWEDRFGGDAWFEFLGSCRATLGSESGASVFNLGGELARRCERAVQKLGSFREDPDYAEAYLAEFADLEDNVNYRQISPRHFEAAATGTAQILHSGRYSDILSAGRHYLPLARDYSNLDAAIDFVRDEPRRRQMIETAYEEIILSRENWIESFVERFDDLLEKELDTKGLLSKPRLAAVADKHILLIAPHDPKADPRLDWIATGAGAGIKIHQLGMLAAEENAYQRETVKGSFIWGIPLQVWKSRTCERWHPLVNNNAAGVAGLHELQFFENLLALSDDRFCAFFSAPKDHPSLGDFRWYLQFMLDAAMTFVNYVLDTRGFAAIIATDLLSMPAALVLKGIFKAPLLFDAHEYWPESSTTQLEFERQFWQGLEKRLVPYTEYRQTVSPGLARLMSCEYGMPFECVPNCEPANRSLPFTPRRERAKGECYFLFQGGFSVHRGIDLLIKAWPKTDSRAVLLLRGLDSKYKNEMQVLAKQSGLLGSRIFFPKAVTEGDLIEAAAEADVGICPYAPVGKNYENCCPNKISQYMAAGLAILANRTSFVESLIHEAGCGQVVNFNNPEAIASAVASLIEDAGLREKLGRAGHRYFQEKFNWNLVSGPLYKALDHLTEKSASKKLQFFITNLKATATANLEANAAAAIEAEHCDFAQAEHGASVLGSSGFFPRPHDADYLLRPATESGYAAGLPDLAQWIEIDLGQPRAVEAGRIAWLDQTNFGVEFAIEGRLYLDQDWEQLFAASENQLSTVEFRFAARWARYVRLSATRFAGQDRMLIRRFHVFACLDQAAAGELPSHKAQYAPGGGLVGWTKTATRLVPPSIRGRLAAKMKAVLVQYEEFSREGREWIAMRIVWRLLPTSIRSQIVSRLRSLR